MHACRVIHVHVYQEYGIVIQPLNPTPVNPSCTNVQSNKDVNKYMYMTKNHFYHPLNRLHVYVELVKLHDYSLL